MKKLLMVSIGMASLCSFTTQGSVKYTMPKTYQSSGASMIQFDQRRVNAMVQRTVVSARDGIIAVLAAAENEGLNGGTGYNQVAGVANLRKVAEDKFIGLADGTGHGSVKINTDGVIQFLMDPSEIDTGVGIGKFTITYTPVLEGSGADGSVYTGTTDQYIDGWTCKTTASTETRLGRGHVTHSADTVEPMFMGLGYPFELCTIVDTTPVVSDI
jgi:hypothetical protein